MTVWAIITGVNETDDRAANDEGAGEERLAHGSGEGGHLPAGRGDGPREGECLGAGRDRPGDRGHREGRPLDAGRRDHEQVRRDDRRHDDGDGQRVRRVAEGVVLVSVE